MIVSHRDRRIFLKTRKTAGTSIKIALNALCGPDDIITPLIEEDEQLRFERTNSPTTGWSTQDTRKDGVEKPVRRRDFFNGLPHVPASKRLAFVITSMGYSFN